MQAKNPRYSNAEKTLIDIEIEHPKFGWIPFSASPNDSLELGRDLFYRATSGEFGDIEPYVQGEENAASV